MPSVQVIHVEMQCAYCKLAVMLGCHTSPANAVTHETCGLDTSSNSGIAGSRQQADLLLLLHLVLLQVQLGLAHVVAKVHGPLLDRQIMQLLHLLWRKPPQRQLLQLLFILLLL